jgi:hypothetical protein
MSIYVMGSAILDHSFVVYFAVNGQKQDIIGEVPEEKKEKVLPAINPDVRRKMRTNKWNLARCQLCGFHFEPDMHIFV